MKTTKNIEDFKNTIILTDNELLNIKGGRSDSGDREDLLIVE